MLYFTLNSKTYETDLQTLEVLHSTRPNHEEAHAKGEISAFELCLHLGLVTGRIREVRSPKRKVNA